MREVKRRVPPLRFNSTGGGAGERVGRGVLGESGTGVREVKRRVPPLRFYSTGGGCWERAGRGGEGG